jgi:hypothetical protein
LSQTQQVTDSPIQQKKYQKLNRLINPPYNQQTQPTNYQQHQQAAQAGDEAAVAQCAKCGSTRVLFSRRQSYNESSTWCGEEEGVPVMLNCLACGAVESQRD